DAALQLDATDLQPRLVTDAGGVNRLLFLREHLQGVSEVAVADIALEGDLLVLELNARRRRQAQGLEELLHGPETGGGWPLHRVSPAVRLVPGRDFPALEQDRRLLGLVLGFLRHLARRTRPGQHAGAGE